ncbi:putative ER lumen protein retaining receptor-like [Capsicum annuum]|nr:putative ER lumen protein retaining receptor-like [Capsicum annuum]
MGKTAELAMFPSFGARISEIEVPGKRFMFMKLRLDRVLQESYEADSLEEALASTPVDLEFEKLEKWTAPHPKYEYGWWESLLPPGSQTSKLIGLSPRNTMYPDTDFLEFGHAAQSESQYALIL